MIPGSDNKEVSSTKDIEKVEVSDEKGEVEVRELEDTYQEVIEKETVVEEIELEPYSVSVYDSYYELYPKHCKVGETHQYTMSDGSVADITITSWRWLGEYFYIEFRIKNVGNTLCTFDTNLFRIYSDGMPASFNYDYDDAFTSATIEPNKEYIGRIYIRLDISRLIYTIQLTVGEEGVPYIIYDYELEELGDTYESPNAKNIGLSNNELDIYFKSFMEFDEISADGSGIEGYYDDKGDGTDIITWIEITEFSIPDENGCIGTANFMYQGDTQVIPFTYNGRNYYSGGGGEMPAIDFAISTLSDMYFIRVVINGEDCGLLKRE